MFFFPLLIFCTSLSLRKYLNRKELCPSDCYKITKNNNLSFTLNLDRNIFILKIRIFYSKIAKNRTILKIYKDFVDFSVKNEKEYPLISNKLLDLLYLERLNKSPAYSSFFDFYKDKNLIYSDYEIRLLFLKEYESNFDIKIDPYFDQNTYSFKDVFIEPILKKYDFKNVEIDLKDCLDLNNHEFILFFQAFDLDEIKSFDFETEVFKMKNKEIIFPLKEEKEEKEENFLKNFKEKYLNNFSYALILFFSAVFTSFYFSINHKS